MSNKLTDKEKISRVKASVLRGLSEKKSNPDKGEVLGYLTATLCNIFAILDADKNDYQSIQFVATELWIEVQGEKIRTRLPVSDVAQLELGETKGIISESEQKNQNTPKKSGK
jgi:hypothetical protein